MEDLCKKAVKDIIIDDIVLYELMLNHLKEQYDKGVIYGETIKNLRDRMRILEEQISLLLVNKAKE